MYYFPYMTIVLFAAIKRAKGIKVFERGSLHELGAGLAILLIARDIYFGLGLF